MAILLKEHIFLQHEFLMESGGEPLYAQINRELKTKRLNSAANTLTKSEAMNASKQLYDHYDLDVGPSKAAYQSHDVEQLADNRTDSAKLQNSTTDSSVYYKNLNNNNNNNNNNTNTNTNPDQNQWV